MVRIIYRGKIKNIRQATAKANEILSDESFYDSIKARKEFDMADIPADLIAQLIKNTELEMRVVTYIGSPRVHGYDDRANPDLIHINIFRHDWTNGSIVNTMLHQVVHAVNDLNTDFNFSHGDNKSDGKQDTAPFWIGNHAEELTEQNHSVSRGMVHDHDPETLALDAID